MLTHGNMLSTLEVCRVLLPPRAHRARLAAAAVAPVRAGAGAVLRHDDRRRGPYVRSRNPRVIFEALRELRVTTMVVTPQLLEIFWTAITREVDRQGKRGDVRAGAAASPGASPIRPRRLLFRASTRSWAASCTLFVSAGAYLPPELQRAWEDLGVIVLQGYGATECGPAVGQHRAATTRRASSAGPSRRSSCGWPRARSRDPGRRARRVSPGYWQDPRRPRPPSTPDGWYHTGDIGRFDEHGRLVLSGRTKNIIVLPNGLNVFPEDIEAALQDHGLTQSVVLETAPGRIEAVVLPPGTHAHHRARSGGQEAARRGAGRRGPRARSSASSRPPTRPRHPPAHRRLAALAGARLPAHPHAQDPAGRGPRLGRRGRPAPGPRAPEPEAAAARPLSGRLLDDRDGWPTRDRRRRPPARPVVEGDRPTTT